MRFGAQEDHQAARVEDGMQFKAEGPVNIAVALVRDASHGDLRVEDGRFIWEHDGRGRWEGKANGYQACLTCFSL